MKQRLLHNGSKVFKVSDKELEEFKILMNKKESLDSVIKTVVTELMKLKQETRLEEQEFWTNIFNKFEVDPRCVVKLDPKNQELEVIGIPDGISLNEFESDVIH
jgi:vacuolar-type H+-ATPase subunit E/Vma4